MPPVLGTANATTDSTKGAKLLKLQNMFPLHNVQRFFTRYR